MPNPTVNWTIAVDWNNDGDFSDTGEDITAYVMEAEWRLGFDQPYMSIADESTCELILKNSDKRFSPEYASGPLYGSLLPHRSVKITSQIGGGGTVTHWRGWVESILPRALPNGEQIAILRAHGAIRFLGDATIYLPLLENVTADAIIIKILEQVALPPVQGQVWVLGVTGFSELDSTTILAEVDDTYIETGLATFPYVGDTWDEGMTGAEALYLVISSERGHFYYNRAGYAAFWNRQHLQLTDTNTATFSDTLLDVEYSYGEDMANVIEVSIQPRVLSASTTDELWSLDEAITLSPGQERTIRAQFKSSEDAQIAGRSVGLPVGGDFIADAGIVIAGFTVAATSAEITVLNAGVTDGDVTTLVVRGQKLTSYKPQVISASDGDSIALYGRRVLTIDAGMLSDGNYADSLAAYMLSRRKDPRGAIRRVHLGNKNSDMILFMQARTVGDRITITETQTGNSDGYVIVGERHQLREALKVWLCEWATEPLDPSNTWILGTSGRSELGSTTRLGF